MRLIHTTDLTLRNWAADPPPYAILSHRWGADDEEVSYQDFIRGTKKTTSGYNKIVRLCQLARDSGLDWAWIDTSCIDTDSSTELSEAVNSMFAWYKCATICYVFFNDSDMRIFNETLPWVERQLLPSFTIDHNKPFDAKTTQEFQKSWFGRGWTLQELLAPKSLTFYHIPDSLAGVASTMLGTKEELKDRIIRATGIREKYLLHQEKIADASIAQRMSWASRRTTTRPEDMSYCMLGLFDVNMTLLYGEGYKAFLRLQQSILDADSKDETIFAWESSGTETNRGLLAKSPAEFGRYPCLRLHHLVPSREPHRFTGKGVELQDVLRPISLPRKFARAWELRKAHRASVLVWLDCSCTCRKFLYRGIAIELSTTFPYSSRALWQPSSSQWIRHQPQTLVSMSRPSSNRHIGYDPIFVRTWLRETEETWDGGSVKRFSTIRLNSLSWLTLVLTVIRIVVPCMCLALSSISNLPLDTSSAFFIRQVAFLLGFLCAGVQHVYGRLYLASGTAVALVSAAGQDEAIAIIFSLLFLLLFFILYSMLDLPFNPERLARRD